MSKAKINPEVLDQNMPADVEAEMAVIGSMLQKQDACDDVAAIVCAADFDDDRNGVLFSAIMELRNTNRRVDTKLLFESLKKTKQAERAGGAVHIAECHQAVPTAVHAAYYAQIVRDRAIVRDIIAAGADMTRKGYAQEASGKELLEEFEQRIFAISENRSSLESVTDLSELLVRSMNRIDASAESHGMVGLSTGFTDLDALLGGMRESELLILAARPSMGKSALAMNIAEHVSRETTTLFVSLEMSAIDLTDRVLCGLAKVNCSRARGGNLTQDERKQICEAMAKLSVHRLVIDDTATRSMTEIAALARRYKRKQNLGLLIVDYLGLIQPENHRDPREIQVAKIARRLKSLARELNIPVLCLAQLNRQTEATNGGRPRLSNLRESGAIEQDADVVMFVHRAGYYDKQAAPGEAEIIIAKQRTGPTGVAHLVWQEEFIKFQNAARRSAWSSMPVACGSGVSEFDPNDPRWGQGTEDF